MDGGGRENFLRGGADNDTITSFGGGDSLEGYTDDDLIYGGSGNDTLTGDDGADVLYGGADNDWLIGGYGGDVMYGEHGDDSFFPIYGDDTMYGGTGNDYVLSPDVGPSQQEMYGGNGSDLFYVSSGTQGVVSGGNDSGYDTLRLFWLTSATLSGQYHHHHGRRGAGHIGDRAVRDHHRRWPRSGDHGRHQRCDVRGFREQYGAQRRR